MTETRVIPSHEVVNALLDVPTTLTGKGIKVGVIDTGIRNKTGQFDDLTIQKVKGWTGADWHGHGTHIASLIGGDAIETPYGRFEGVAPDAQIVSIKAFDPSGYTSTSTVIRAMEFAIAEGCDVVNISSGSVQYDDVFHLAEHKVMQEHPEVIFVSSAGNIGKEWSITTPSLSPMAICVGSISITDRELSHFSSKGPQGAWYRDHPDVYEKHLEMFGEDLIKPDCVAFGGGRATKGAKPVEVIGASMSGWFESFYDGRYDNYGGAQGTSQSAALVSGLIALLLEGGIITSADDFKKIMKATWNKPKSHEIGYGLPVLSRFV
jgi:subtilisin family serine protease